MLRQKNGVFVFLSPIFLSPIFLSGGRSDDQGRGFESRWERSIVSRSRSLTGKAAGLYPASAGSARDPSSNLGGSSGERSVSRQRRLSVNQDVAGSSPVAHLEIVGMSSNWQDGRLWIYLSRFESSHPSFVPVAQLEERAVDGREVVGSTPTGYIEFVGRWCSRSTRSALNREMVGSNQIRPICSIRKIRDSIFFLTGRNDEQRRIGKELAKSFRRRPVERDNRVCRQATISSGIVA